MEFSPDVIAAAKARYAELKAAGQAEGAFEARRDASPQPGDIPEDRIVAADTIPGGWYWHGIVRAGEVLSIANDCGNEGVSLLLWNAHEPSERLNPPDTVKVQWTAAIGRGRVLLSDMGRAMVSVVGGPEGLVDCLSGVSTPHSNALKYGDGTLPAASVHFLRAAAKHGLGKRDVGPAITLFAPVRVGADGALGWDEAARLSARFDLRAEMDLIAALSNTPHPLGPSASYAPQPVTITVWRADPPGEGDLCRTATPEAARAFQNNAAMRTGGAL